MAKIIENTAKSLNGKIAKSDGSVDWLDTLPNPDQLDYGYHKFYNSIGTTIMGYKTYAQVKGWDIAWPYPGKKNYVLSRKKDLTDTEDVTFITNDHISFLKDLKETTAKDIWLIGGGQVNTLILNSGLLDELIVHTMPIILTSGIELFEESPAQSMLHLTIHKVYPTGVIEARYRVGS